MYLNGIPTHKILSFLNHSGKLSTSIKNLNLLGIRTNLPSNQNKAKLFKKKIKEKLNDKKQVHLSDISNLKFSYQVATQTIFLKVKADRLAPIQLNATHSRNKPRQIDKGTGLIINYDVSAQIQKSPRYGILSDQRFFSSSGLLDNSFAAYWSGHGNFFNNADNRSRKIIRFNTSWRSSNLNGLTTTRIGDAISSSLSWSRSVRLAGIQFSRDFSLRPDLITFPVPELSSSSAVPTAVELYVNNVKQFNGQIAGGPFVINGTPVITGGGNAVIVTHDALGRAIQTNIPLYIDARLLKKGLSDYSAEIGVLRHNYGLESFNYSLPAFSSTLRYGVISPLTVEIHNEGSKGLFLSGLGALINIPYMGIFNSAFSVSRGKYDAKKFDGSLINLGWQYHASPIYMDAQWKQTFGHYGDLAAITDTMPSHRTFQGNISTPINTLSSFGLNYIDIDDNYIGRSQIATFSYTTSLQPFLSLSANLYRDFGDLHNIGFYLSITFPFGKTEQASFGTGIDHHQVMLAANVSHNSDYSGGLSWQAQTARLKNQQQSLLQAQYIGQHGDISGLLMKNNHYISNEINASGSLLRMEKNWFAGKRIDNAFALVSTNGIAGVPVSHENRFFGKTNRKGLLLIPNLLAYQNNHLAIDVLNLPVNTKTKVTHLCLAPAARAGAVARFPLSQYNGAQIIFVTKAGQIFPIGSHVTHLESGKKFVVGFDGLTFIDDLQSNNRFKIQSNNEECFAQLHFYKKNNQIPIIKNIKCTKKQDFKNMEELIGFLL